MIESLFKKYDYYKQLISEKYDKLYLNSSDFTRIVFKKSKKKIDLKKAELVLKKSYYNLGKYVAQQYMLNKHSDFSLDKRFQELSDKVEKKAKYYKLVKQNIQIEENNK